MTSHRNIPPRIRWGATFQNAVDFAYPLDNVKAGSTKRDGSVEVQGPSGVEDAWTIGIDYVLTGDVRWVPQNYVIGPPKALGWDNPTWDTALGVRAFLEWARDKNQFYWHPDGRNLVASPTMSIDANSDGVVDDFAFFHDAGLTATPSLDSINAAQKLVLSAGVTGASQVVEVSQTIASVLAGEVVTLSFDYQTAALVNCSGIAYLEFFDSTGASLAAPATAFLTSPSFVRASVTATAPANAEKATIKLRLQTSGSGATGTIWFRNAMIRRDGVIDTTFIANPAILSYLTAPMKDPADSEPDGTRKFTLGLRNSSTDYSGY